jgi:hypothetical protein
VVAFGGSDLIRGLILTLQLSINQWEWHCILFGNGRLAAIRNAGQYIAWNLQWEGHCFLNGFDLIFLIKPHYVSSSGNIQVFKQWPPFCDELNNYITTNVCLDCFCSVLIRDV